MVDKKPAAKPAPSTTDAKPITATNTTTRPSLPPLSPLPDARPSAASVQPATSTAVTTASEKAAQPASTETQPTAAPASPAKPVEKLGPKLRAKGEIIAALRAGAHVLHTESGLYRIVSASGSFNPASKRRILALIQQGILKATEADKRKFVLDAEAEKKASEKKPATTPEALATEEKK